MAMYNRYIPNGSTYARIPESDSPPPLPEGQEVPAADGSGDKKGLSAILKSLKLDDLDTGDVLILLILLFLFLEGDDIEMMITLGLMLLLGLD